jgi:hypothetical protein
MRLRVVERRPYERTVVRALDELPVGPDGLLVWSYRGQRHFQPVTQSQLALALLDGYHQDGDARRLDLAIRNARDIAEHLSEDYLSYGYDMALHGDEANTIHAPWHSAMAQGQFLSVVSRLAEETGEQEWRSLADRMFATLADVQRGDALPDRPWASFVDDEGHLWLEEYSGDIAPMQVLNGHLFATFGVYDYWHLTGRADAEALFLRAAETVLAYFPRLRVPGQASWYGMRVQDRREAQSEKYHRIHISQLRYIADMTGDERFARMADAFDSDVPVSERPVPLQPLV